MNSIARGLARGAESVVCACGKIQAQMATWGTRSLSAAWLEVEDKVVPDRLLVAGPYSGDLHVVAV